MSVEEAEPASAPTFWHHHGGVSVPDLDAAVAWYARVLGFQVEKRVALSNVPCDMAMVRNGPLRIELFAVPGASAPAEDRSQPDADLRTWGNKHFCFGVENVEAFAQALRARGADIVWVKRFSFGANIFIRDMAGNLIEFVEARPTPSSAHADLPSHNG